MGTFLKVTGVILLLALVAVVIAFFAVDVNQFRPLILSKIEEATGRPAELASIHRSFKQGLGIELNNLVIYEDPQFGEEPMLSVAQATARLRLAPLLQRRVELAAITLKQPTIRVIKDAAGRLSVQTMKPAGAATPSKSGKSGAKAAALPLLVTTLHIEDGHIEYHDLSPAKPMTLVLRDADVTASDIRLEDGVPQATLQVRNGVLTLSQLSQPLENISLDARLTPVVLSVQKASVEIGDGWIEAKGNINDYRTLPRISGDVSLQGLAVQELSPPELAKAPQHLEGKLSGRMQVEGTGKTWPELQPTLTGTASFTLTDGRVTNVNVLRQALSKLSMLPDVMARLEAKLPERHRKLLDQQDTELREVKIDARIAQGALLIDPLRIGTDVGNLDGRGRVGLDGTIDIGAMIVIPKDLSTSLIGAVDELAVLADQTGAITFPLTARGKAPQVSVQPDMQYIIDRVIATTGTELINQLINKALGMEEQPAAQPSQQAPPTPEHAAPEGGSSTEKLLQDLFGGER